MYNNPPGVRPSGLEPESYPWKGQILPLYYGRSTLAHNQPIGFRHVQNGHPTKESGEADLNCRPMDRCAGALYSPLLYQLSYPRVRPHLGSNQGPSG